MPPDRLFVGHILDMAQTVQRLIAGVKRKDLDSDEKLQLAVVRALQVIGEAAWRTSPEFQGLHPRIEWKKIAGFRHRLVHDYFSIDYDIVWHIATTEIQPLIDELTYSSDKP